MNFTSPRSIAIIFALVASPFAAAQIDIEREVTSQVEEWSRSSCNNMWYDTECTEGQDSKMYAALDTGFALDISQAVANVEGFEELVSEAFRIEEDTGERPFLTATFTQSLLDYVPGIHRGVVNAHYATSFKIK